MSKIPTITLTPNRSSPRRYLRLVTYHRGTDEQGDYVAPVRNTDGKVVPIRYSEIRGSAVDPEFEAAWLEHVRYQQQLARE